MAVGAVLTEFVSRHNARIREKYRENLLFLAPH